MEPDERDFTGQKFIPYADLIESIAARMKVSVTFDQLPIKNLSVPTGHHMTRILNQIDCASNTINLFMFIAWAESGGPEQSLGVIW